MKVAQLLEWLEKMARPLFYRHVKRRHAAPESANDLTRRRLAEPRQSVG